VSESFHALKIHTDCADSLNAVDGANNFFASNAYGYRVQFV